MLWIRVVGSQDVQFDEDRLHVKQLSLQGEHSATPLSYVPLIQTQVLPIISLEASQLRQLVTVDTQVTHV